MCLSADSKLKGLTCPSKQIEASVVQRGSTRFLLKRPGVSAS
jgi:hypothetical protein